MFIKQIIFFYLLSTITYAQTVSATFFGLANKEIELIGFEGFETYLIAKTKADEKGLFEVSFKSSDHGVGYLISEDRNPLFVILNAENLVILGETFKKSKDINFIENNENQFFSQYDKDNPRREQALGAWNYLEKIYRLDSLFSDYEHIKFTIQNEKKRIINEDKFLLEFLPKSSYVKWFLPIRKLVSSVETIVQYRTEEIPETIIAFRELDYINPRLYKSGLFKDTIESHFWLIENSGYSLEKVSKEMKLSIDAIISKLLNDQKLLNEVTDYLFNLLERQSLFIASEYLALKMLNEENCTLNDDLSKQLETYRTMSKGNIAPDIIFESSKFANPSKTVTKLSELKSKYKLVVFSASWCSKCREEIPLIANLYDKWKSKDLEVVLIAIEENQKEFLNFYKTLPFPSYTELKNWKSKIVNDYFVYSTPTMFLLDDKRQIMLRPSSVKQIDSWVDWHLNN
jgi:thiol-disulfide isomerase/thioredoxin